jgi:hypothetical protein
MVFATASSYPLAIKHGNGKSSSPYIYIYMYIKKYLYMCIYIYEGLDGKMNFRFHIVEPSKMEVGPLDRLCDVTKKRTGLQELLCRVLKLVWKSRNWGYTIPSSTFPDKIWLYEHIVPTK